jgi:protocatechuate 3,4-dioxygenase alpha subunit
MTQQAITRIYFADEAANAADPILALVPAERRATLIATREPGNAATYRFDVHLQGDRETVFSTSDPHSEGCRG